MNNTNNSSIKYILLGLAIFVIGLIMLVAPNFSERPSPSDLTPSIPSSTLVAPDVLADVDSALSETLSASIAYNAPESMKLNETVIVELSLSPSLNEEELTQQINQDGLIASTSVQISPLMKAVLIARNDSAFAIEALHTSDEQPVDPSEITHWQWKVTANQGGMQGLIMVVYRLVQFDGQGYWREVGTYENNINVQATFGQRLSGIDWKSFGTLIFTSLIVPAFWRWADRRNNKKRKAAK